MTLLLCSCFKSCLPPRHHPITHNQCLRSIHWLSVAFLLLDLVSSSLVVLRISCFSGCGTEFVRSCCYLGRFALVLAAVDSCFLLGSGAEEADQPVVSQSSVRWARPVTPSPISEGHFFISRLCAKCVPARSYIPWIYYPIHTTPVLS